MRQQTMFSIKKEDDDICARKHGGAETSIEADKTVKKEKDREQVYGLIYHAGRFGHTLDELCIMLHRAPNQLSGRLTELRVAGRIVISDESRLTRTHCWARVYRASGN